MKEIKSNITIARPTSNCEDDYISIELSDDDSRVRVVNIKIDLINFAKAVTGLGYCDCNATIFDCYDILGMKKITQQVELPDYIFTKCKYDKKDRLQAINKYIGEENILCNGEWMLWSDGLSTQQNTFGIHNIIIYKYVEITNHNGSRNDPSKNKKTSPK